MSAWDCALLTSLCEAGIKTHNLEGDFTTYNWRSFSDVSLPRETGPGPAIEQADSEEAEEKNVIYRTVASIPIGQFNW